MAWRFVLSPRALLLLSCLIALECPAQAEFKFSRHRGGRAERAIASLPDDLPHADLVNELHEQHAEQHAEGHVEHKSATGPRARRRGEARRQALIEEVATTHLQAAAKHAADQAAHRHTAREPSSMWVSTLEDKRLYAAAPVVFLTAAALAHAALGRNPSSGCEAAEAPASGDEGHAGLDDSLPDSGLAAIFLLTSYRFFTGFLGATWAPFLIAREGATLGDRQSLFIGSCKLIYGASICLNPFLGFLNDRMAKTTSFCGRSAFLTAGVLICTTGIVLCQHARDSNDFTFYLFGASVWMIGEAMADTTTECVVPELLPARQFDLASSIRSLNFLTGCLVGLVSLIVFKDMKDYTWLYAAYLLVMYACALATIMLIQYRNRRQVSHGSEVESWSAVLECYTKPMRYAGGFPGACLCLLIFSFGIAPMFFPLLIVRDLCGIDEVTEQLEFSAKSSILFTVCAALGSIAINLSKGDGEAAGEKKDLDKTVLIVGMIAFGIVSGATPVMSFSDVLQTRKIISASLSGLIGLSFGAVYARFQSCLWQTLPPDADLANAMGFASVPKVCGCGIGSFVAGVALDAFRIRGDPGQHVSVGGYWVICLICTGTSFLAAGLLYQIRLKS